MADLMYTPTKNKLWRSQLPDLVTADLRIALLTSGYVFSAAHEFVTDLGANILTNGRSTQLQNVAVSGGALDFDDIVIAADPGQASNALVLYRNSGADGTSELLIYRTRVFGFPIASTAVDGVKLIFSGGNFKFAAFADFLG